MRDSMLGKVFALCTDEEQAAFLNEAGRALRAACRTGDGNGDTMQLLMIVDHLDGNGRSLIKRLAEAIVSDEETPKVVHRVEYRVDVRDQPADEAANG